MSVPPNFRYSNPPQGTPPVHDDMAARKSLQLTDARDKKIANLITVSYVHEDLVMYILFIIYTLFPSLLIPTVLAASSREVRTTWRKDNKSRYSIVCYQEVDLIM